MKHGDISNQVGFTIGFRCVDFFVKFRDNKLSDKVLNFVVGKTKRAVVDDSVAGFIEYIYRNTEMTVDLILEEEDNTPSLREFLEDYPFNRIVVVQRPSQITQRLLIGDLSYYVDDDDYRRSLVNNSHAITLKQLEQMIRRGGR